MYSVPLLDYLLIGVRMAGMIFTAPIFSTRNYPVRMKLGLILFTTILIYPLIQSGLTYRLDTALDFSFYLLNELLTGIFIGFSLSVFMNFIYFAGGIIDREIGFAMVNVISPMDESELPITANIFYVFSILIFLHLDLHHRLITTLVLSFGEIPLGTGFMAAGSFSILLDIFVNSFILGFRLAAPFTITVLIANIILGMLAKAMPGMNVFILGMPFKIFFGLLMFIVLMPFMFDIFVEFLKSSFDFIGDFFRLYRSG